MGGRDAERQSDVGGDRDGAETHAGGPDSGSERAAGAADGDENAGLREVFADWLRSAIEQCTPVGEELPALDSLEEVRMTLEERAKEWPVQWMREGREQGRELGLEQGRKLGFEQGLERGREEGLEHERALLCRMAALRFGVDTSERLAALLANVADADRLADVGERLVQCRAADEFLTQAEMSTRPID